MTDKQAEAESVFTRLVQEVYPHGDPRFAEITLKELALYDAKNQDYAGGGDDPNGNFNRVAAFWGMYPGIKLSDPRVVAISHMMKQLDQICWSISRGYEGVVEGLDPRFADVHVYAKIARVINSGMAKQVVPSSEVHDAEEHEHRLGS